MQDTVVSCPRCGAKNRLKPESGSRSPACGKCRSPLPWIVDGTDISFRRELEAPVPVLVDFWADWCAPCRMTAPVLEEYAGEQAGRLKLIRMNVDRNPATAGQFNVRSIPTLILFRDGQPVETVIGALSKSALRERLDPRLG
ncbi:MAG: thioredoxin [Acidobacteriota bacterium]|jgi:thioredoxin 2|nr:thioredoxin [Acidobacteriota bacterium]NLT33120.1 thioredoxin [Acidobacteriota bacterium]